MIYLFLYFAIGLVLGSFTTCIAYRSEKNESWFDITGTKSRSVCTNCNKELSPMDLIPLFSWLFLRGKCRHCNKKINKSYPIIELSSAIATSIAYVVHGSSAEFFMIMSLIPFLIALTVVDIKKMLLPDSLMIPCLVIALGYLSYASYASENYFFIVERLFAGVIFSFAIWLCGYFLKIIMKKDTLGFSDVKFMFISGILLGIEQFHIYLIIVGISAIAYNIVSGNKNKKFPMGPSLIASLYILLLIK